MKRIVRLTEGDLVKLVKQVINEKVNLQEGVSLELTPETVKKMPAEIGTFTISNDGKSIKFKLENGGSYHLNVNSGNPTLWGSGLE
jgi:hypothetical protein